jgi:two-component system chemotaxis response regulator CheB
MGSTIVSSAQDRKVRAAIVDDSAVVRKYLADILRSAGIEVVSVSPDPVIAWEKMQSDWPDVIVLDVEMPRMDGITFLRKIMAERPTPCVMCSTLTLEGAETTLQALSSGAVAFVSKPQVGLKDFIESGADNIAAVVRSSARANARAATRVRPPAVALRKEGEGGPTTIMGHANVAGPRTSLAQTTDRVVAIGLSTGGVQAIETVLTGLPRTSPGIVIVQHMPEKFTGALAGRLNRICRIEVSEAVNGERIIAGRALIAPGGRHMKVVRSGAQYLVEVFDGPVVNHHRPSVDVLFRSVAASVGRNATGIIMTGMGNDGARGLLEMRQAGARTAAQDEASSVVFGMPMEAIRLGAAGTVIALEQISGWIQKPAAADD